MEVEMKIKISAIISVFFFVLLVPHTLLQAFEIREGGAGGFMLGVQWLDLSELNSELRANGFKSFNAYDFSYGGAGYGIIGNRLLIGGEGHGFSQEKSNSTYLQSLSGGFGFFDVGYIVVQRWGFQLYPMIGIGGGGLSMRLTERAVLDFDDIVTDPKREALLSVGSFMLQGAVGLDYMLKLGVMPEMSEGGMLFGIRVGYTYSVTKTDWDMGDINISGGPDIGISGFYIRFIVGGYGFETHTNPLQ
jgi:hypothetical protein